MKTPFVIITALLALAVAVDVGPIVNQTPTCAYGCLQQAVQAQGCGYIDYGCQCNAANLAAITTKGNLCLTYNSSCEAQDISKAGEVGAKLCAAVLAGSTSGSPATITTVPVSAATIELDSAGGKVQVLRWAAVSAAGIAVAWLA